MTAEVTELATRKRSGRGAARSRLRKYTPANSFNPRPPDGRSRGTLSQAIREHLCREGGVSTRDKIACTLEADQRLADKLAKSEGVNRLLYVLELGGFVTLDGETVRATKRTLQQTVV